MKKKIAKVIIWLLYKVNHVLGIPEDILSDITMQNTELIFAIERKYIPENLC